MNVLNSFAILVSGAPDIDKYTIIGRTHGGTGAPENDNAVRGFRDNNSTPTIYDQDE